jgi:hypothetical protein
LNKVFNCGYFKSEKLFMRIKNYEMGEIMCRRKIQKNKSSNALFVV